MFVPLSDEDVARLRLAEFIAQSLVSGQLASFLRREHLVEDNIKKYEELILRLAQELHGRPYSFTKMEIPACEETYPKLTAEDIVGPERVVFRDARGGHPVRLNQTEEHLVIDGKRVEAMQSLRARIEGLTLAHAKAVVEKFETTLDSQ